VRNAAPSPGRFGSVEKIHVERLRKFLFEDKAPWRGIEVDDEALAALEKANPEGAAVIDPGEDKEARKYTSTKSTSGTVEEAMAADLIEKDELDDSQALIDTKCVLKA
jgi:hypothetical protein